MTLKMPSFRRGLIIVCIGTMTIGWAACQPRQSASAPKAVSSSIATPAAAPRAAAVAAALTPVTVPTPVTEPAPPPEPEPEPAPPPAPKKKAPAPKAAPKPATANTGSERAQLVSLVNQYRAANGLAALSQAGDAMAKAQQHAEEMAAQGRIFHSSSMASGINGGWSSLGENVGMGGSVGQIEGMFEASGPHRANLLSDSFNQIGVGVAFDANGQMYVTQVFVGR